MSRRIALSPLLIAASIIMLATAQAHAAPKIVHVRLAGAMNESPPAGDFAMLLGEAKPNTFLELIRKLDKAAADEDVRAIAFTLDAPGVGLSQVMELRDAIRRLRTVGKEVYCHAESLGLGGYLIAANCSTIAMVPTGDLPLMGIAAEIGFYKGMLDKIGVTADMLHIGDYKGAAEPYTRTEPTPEYREQTERLIDDVYRQIVESIAESRGVTEERAAELIDNGPYTAEWALEAGLIDQIAYRKEFVEDVKARHAGAEVDNDYGDPAVPEIDFNNPFALFSELRKLFEGASAPASPMVAVIYVDGLIHSGRNEANPFLGVTAGSKTIGRTLEEAARDPMVKAVVLRVDSPGGSALASEIIWKATQEVSSRKPLVVSMGNVAGSGGYYVSCGAPTIFADATTMTGSIGVVGGKLVLHGLWDKLGISTYAVTRGKHAAMYSSEQPFSDSERAKAIALMEHVYKQFKDRVVTGRGGRLKGEIDSLAGGRVYTGRQALAIGLVDRIGGLHDAIRHAAGEARIGEYEVEVLPRPKNIFEQLMESMSGEHDEDRLMAGPTRELLQGASMLGAVASLRRLDPQAAESLVNAVARLMLFRQERVLAVTPADVIIR